MSALETVRTAYRAGVLLSKNGERLVLSGREKLSPELRAALVRHRRTIVTILTVYGVGTDDGYGELEGVRAGPKRFATPSGCLASAVCARLGWYQRALDGLCCDQAEVAVLAFVLPCETLAVPQIAEAASALSGEDAPLGGIEGAGRVSLRGCREAHQPTEVRELLLR